MMPELVCLDCLGNNSPQFTSVSELEAHIAGEHLNMCVYECERCRFAKFPTEYALISHCKNDHGLKEFSIKYRYSQEIENLKEQLADRVRKCVDYRTSGQKMSDAVFPNNYIKLEENQVMGITPPIPTMSPSLNQSNSASTMMEYYAHIDDNIQPRASQSSKEHRQEDNEGKRPRILIECLLCGERVAKQRSSMMYHANTRHSKFDLYQCKACGKTWQTIARSDVLKHIKTHHESPDGEVNLGLINDFRKLRGDELREITSKCFPMSQSRTGTMKGASPRSTDDTIEDDDFQIEEVGGE